jgi:type IV pilus assembly protein PilQ
MSMDVQRAEIHTVLRAIAEYSGVSIVADNNVTGTVTVRAEDLTWREMLETVCRSAQLVSIADDPVIRVATAKTASDEALARESAARKAEEFMPLTTHIIPINYASAEELVDVLSTATSPRGRVEADSRTNSLLLTDIEPRLDLLADMAHHLDDETAQVEIVAKIVDVDVTEARQLGISWSGSQMHSYGANADAQISLNPADIVDPSGDLRVGIIRSFGQIQAKLQALESENKADIISTPRITTVNNRMARILVGKEVPLITLDEAGNAITELKKVGITLEVTPYINSDDMITMDLHPEVSDLSQQSTIQGGIVFNTTEADTRVMVHAGETAVIGGLIRTSEIHYKRGVPWLREIPLLGKLFGSSDKRTEKREVLIFVTPSIIRPSMVAALPVTP